MDKQHVSDVDIAGAFSQELAHHALPPGRYVSGLR